MFHNPEFLRNVRIQLTPRRALFAGGLTVTLIIISYFLMWSGTEPTPYSPKNYSHLHEFGDASFKLLLFAQFVLLHVMATSAVGGSMVQERMRGTLLFQQMTLLSSHEMLLGKLFGSMALCYGLAALITPFALLSALLGGIEPHNLLWIYGLLIVGGLCWQAIGLFISCAIACATESAGRNLMGLSYSIGGVASVFSLFIFSSLWRPQWHMSEEVHYFYGFPISSFSLTLGIMLFVGVWAYIGAVRAFKELQLIRLSPRPIWYFFLSLEALLVGLFWGAITQIDEHPNYYYGYYYREAMGLVISYLVINWMALTALAGVTSVGRNQLREWWSAEHDAISMLKRSELRNALITYPIAVGIAVIGLAALWQSLNMRLQQLGVVNFHFNFGILIVAAFGFIVTMAAMAGFIQFWSMHRFRVASRAGVALWVLFFIMAGIAGGIFGETSIPALLNPLVLTAITLDNPGELSYMAKGLIVESGFAVICLGLAYWKWRRTRYELIAV